MIIFGYTHKLNYIIKLFKEAIRKIMQIQVPMNKVCSSR